MLQKIINPILIGELAEKAMELERGSLIVVNSIPNKESLEVYESVRYSNIAFKIISGGIIYNKGLTELYREKEFMRHDELNILN